MRNIFFISKADFLQRIRSYQFLITLAVCVFIAWTFLPPLNAPYVSFTVDNFRGTYNIAWISTVMALMTSLSLSLGGFYLINTALKRDIETGVGQIIAATPIKKSHYLLGKFFSNYAVLLIIIILAVLTSAALYFLRGEGKISELFNIFSPFFFLTMPMTFFISALAIFSEVIATNYRIFINVLYFFLWGFFIRLTNAQINWPINFLLDLHGIKMVSGAIILNLNQKFPGLNLDSEAISIGYHFLENPNDLQFFVWDGISWSFEIIFFRIFWIILSIFLILLTSLFFKRFEQVSRKFKKPLKQYESAEKSPDYKLNSITTNLHLLTAPFLRFGILAPLKNEIKLMLKSTSPGWLFVIIALFIATFFSPLSIAHTVLLPILWLLQLPLWSNLGSREITYNTEEYIFATAYPWSRNLIAQWLAAILIMLFSALVIIIRLGLSGNIYSLFGIIIGAFFIASLALFCGIWTKGSKLFEVLHTIFVYSILNKISFLDYLGITPPYQLLSPLFIYFFTSIILLLLSILKRKISKAET